MNMFFYIKKEFLSFLSDFFFISDVVAKKIVFNENTELKRVNFLDISCNAPFILSRILENSSIDKVNEKIISNFKNNFVENIETAGAGFLNFKIKKEVYENFLNNLIENKIKLYEKNENPISFNIEFVSANPTGPLHIGHGRGGIIGDVLANILKKLGHKVSKEFYINDAGNQIKKLGLSVKLRYQEICGDKIEFPADGYNGEYISDIAKELFEKERNELLNNDISWFGEYAKNILLEKIKETLNKYGIIYDVWFSEKKLHENNILEKVLFEVEKNGYIEKKDKAVWFLSSKEEDDKDRVLRKTNGEYTYAASDLAYLKNKIDRRFDKLVLILGQDHHGYVSRLKSFVVALGYDEKVLDVILYQLVTIKKNGEAVRLSKRKGNIVSLEDIIDNVGRDVSRFFYLNKKADSHLDFDIEIAMEQSHNNPVYYIQYAIVRLKSILRRHDLTQYNDLENEEYFYNDIEKMLLRKINQFDEVLNSIAKNYHTHLLAYYVLDLTSIFHLFYNDYVCINENKKLTSLKRIKLVKCLLKVYEETIVLLGMESPEVM
jgi:arginyl-tRNA synthetase